MTILEFKFKNDNSVFSYLHYLISEDLQYHFDDCVHDIVWNKTMSHYDLAIMNTNAESLKNYCDIWAWFDRHPDMWETWKDGMGNRESGSDNATGLTYLHQMRTENTGGGCMVDILMFEDGRYLGVTDESVVLYPKDKTENDFLQGGLELQNIDLAKTVTIEGSYGIFTVSARTGEILSKHLYDDEYKDIVKFDMDATLKNVGDTIEDIIDNCHIDIVLCGYECADGTIEEPVAPEDKIKLRDGK